MDDEAKAAADRPAGTAPGGTSGSRAVGRWARTGWIRAFAGALIAGGVGLAVAELAALGFALAGGSAGSTISVARAGALLFYAFHHVPLSFEAGITTPLGTGGAHIEVSLAAAPMLGTLVVGAGLFLAGRSLARAASGRATGISVPALAATGAKVALPYALLCAAGVPIARLTVTPTGTARVLLHGAFTVGPAIVPAFVWALVLAAVAGAVGAVTTWRPEAGSASRSPRAKATDAFGSGFGSGSAVAPAPDGAEPAVAPARSDRAAAAAVVGGSVMALVGVVLAFAGLLVMAAVDDHATHRYFDTAFRGGLARGSAAVGLTALEVPNMATWVLYPAMGSCVAVVRSSGSVGGKPAAGTSSGGACVLSLRRRPSSAVLARAGSLGRVVGSGFANAPTAPPAYLFFMMVPAIAVLAGGWVASGRAARLDSRDRRSSGASAGALAGVVFVAWTPVLVLLSTIVVTVGGVGAAGLGGQGTVAVGPSLLLSIVVAAAWGVVGGAAGGALRTLVVRRWSAPVRERVFPERPLPAGTTELR